MPPFDDVRARRAVSYAVDRAQAARDASALSEILFMGPMEAARPTCQVLPPSLPEYRAYCPFTLHPSTAGTWSAPDLAKARRLVRASGTLGAEVRVEVTARKGASTPEMRLARSTLEPLGYRVSFVYYNPFPDDVRTVDDPLTFSKPKKFTPPQITLYGSVDNGIEGYPSPFTSFSPLTCVTPSPWACSKLLDRQIRRALALEARDPAAARKAWAEVDRHGTDLATYVPLLTPLNLDVVSKRVGNFQRHPLYGVLFDQLWVR
jgi:peptide/nickel transport system substrate-binding protein